MPVLEQRVRRKDAPLGFRKPRAQEAHPIEGRAAQICFHEVGAAQVRPQKVGIREVGAYHPGAAEVGKGQVRMRECRVLDERFCERAARKQATGKVGIGQVSAPEIREAQVRIAEYGALQVKRREVRGMQRNVRKVSLPRAQPGGEFLYLHSPPSEHCLRCCHSIPPLVFCPNASRAPAG